MLLAAMMVGLQLAMSSGRVSVIIVGTVSRDWSVAVIISQHPWLAPWRTRWGASEFR
jgi:hypothetical protein